MANPARLTRPTLIAVISVTVVAYAIHSLSWVVHEIQGGSWIRWMEIVYLTTFFVWVGGFILAVSSRKIRGKAMREVQGDERTVLLFLKAHQAALVTTMLVQLPFFFLDIPVRALATATTAVVSLAISYAWLDR
jgi:hypothetical protein